MKNFKELDEKLCDGVKPVSRFSYLGDRLNTNVGCETAVAAKTRIGRIKFRECSEILKGKRFSLKMKKKANKSCCRSHATAPINDVTNQSNGRAATKTQS